VGRAWKCVNSCALVQLKQICFRKWCREYCCYTHMLRDG